jgi:iron complex outermembrane receptor protein
MHVCFSYLPHKRIPAATLALLFCSLASARAATAEGPVNDLTTVPLEQLLSMEVFSASRFTQRASEAPSSVTVITAADIRTFGWRTLADVARSVRGLHVNYDRNYSYLGGRGFLRPGDYNTRFLLQVNGNRVNDAVYDLAPLGNEFPLDLDLVERIEFVPGPGSSSYGSNAFFGVINVITRAAGDPAANRVAAEAGSAGARKGTASASWRSQGGTAFLVSASRHLYDGENLYYPEFDTPQENNGIAEGLDYERGARLFASASHGPFSATLVQGRRVKGMPTAALMQPFNDPRSRTVDRQSYVNLAWRDAAGPSEELSARLAHGRYDSLGDYVFSDETRSMGHVGSKARWWGAELTFVSTRFDGHKLVAGIDIQRNYRLGQYIHTEHPDYPDLEDDNASHRSGIYLQDEIALGDAVLLNLGLRHDHGSGRDPATSPRAALIWRVTPATTVKAIHGTAFRTPNSFELNFTFPGEGGRTSNPELRKERIRSSELAVVHDLGNNAHVTAMAFENRVDDLVTLMIDPRMFTTRFENAEPASARGVEVEYERQWQSGASLRASYARARTSRPSFAAPGMSIASIGIDLNSNPPDINSPEHVAKLNAAVPLPFGWRAGIEAQYTGPRNALAGHTPGFWLANVNLASRRLFDAADLSIAVFNLFDRRYSDPASTQHALAGIPQDGRTFRVKLAYAF